MMKSSKLSHKVHKSGRMIPLRKEHISKRSDNSRSPTHLSRSARPVPVKHVSPGMKKMHPLRKRKSSNSPRMHSLASSPHPSSHRSNHGSPVSIDRMRGIKRHKYEKREQSSSPSPHHLPVPHHPPRHRLSVSPYQGHRYPDSRSPVPENYSPPLKKKSLRQPDNYRSNQGRGGSPPRGHLEVPLHRDERMPRRGEIPHPSSLGQDHSYPPPHKDRGALPYEMHNRPPGPPMIPSHPKEPPSMKSAYSSDGRYRDSGLTDRSSSDNEKYAPTLHERFSSVVESIRTEPRIRYSRQDLEKITIDVRCNPRALSPAPRPVMNPSDIKLARRPNEGHRPIFDREEIKQSSRNSREDPYYEHKTEAPRSSKSFDPREYENYEITRHRFESNQSFSGTSSRAPGDRWRGPDGSKISASHSKERGREYERVLPLESSSHVRSRSRSGGDRDFRFERYPGGEPLSSRSTYPDGRHRSAPSEPRDIPLHHKGISPDARSRSQMKRGRAPEDPSRMDSRSQYHSPSDRPYPSREYNLKSDRRQTERISGLEPHKWEIKSRSHSKEPKLPDFSRRPDKYQYKPWLEKPDSTPRGPGYFEHDNRESYDPSYRGRGSSRTFRSPRGFRARGFRGASRGGNNPRGSFRGYRSSTSPRGRGAPRRGRYSPSLWEHDLYSRGSPDRKP